MPYIIKHKEGFYSNLSKEEVEQKCKDLGQKAIEVRYNEQSFDTFSKSFIKPDENIVWDGDTIMGKYWAASKHIAYEEKVDIPREKTKEKIVETIVAVCMFACLFWAIAIDDGRAWERIKQVRTERTNSRTNDALDNSFSNTDDTPQDFSWLYGKWRLTINGETQAITFNSNGTYGQVFSSPMWGTTTEFGTYEIRNGRIYLYDSADGGKHPSTIILEGHQLKEGNHYYVKSY